jgi:hypothetical protein
MKYFVIMKIKKVKKKKTTTLKLHAYRCAKIFQEKHTKILRKVKIFTIQEIIYM